MTQQNGGRIHPIALWMAVLGAGASGITGIGSMGQLDSLTTAVEEQIRVAELRGQLLAEIRANRDLIITNQKAIKDTMTDANIIRLHDSQQSLIDKLIDATSAFATKTELELLLRKTELLKGTKK